jgi:hypothetical protein
MPQHEKIASKAIKQLILKMEFAALMIIFWGLIIFWPLYNWLAG